MAEHLQTHVTDSRRPTAKSDQRFDANQRRTTQTTTTTGNGKNDAPTAVSNEKKDLNKDMKVDRKIKAEVKIEMSDRNHLEPKDEMKVLKHWGLLKKTLVMQHIIDPLIEKGMMTPEKWMSLKKNEKTEQDTVEEFLYHLLKCKHDGYGIFLDALKSRGYGHVANQLEGLNTDDHSPTTSVSSGGSNPNRHIGRPPTINRILPRHNIAIKLQDPRNGAASDGQTSGATMEQRYTHKGPISEVATASVIVDATVKQEDLHRMKEEITTELRQLRENIEKDRDDDRLELRILQRKHTELQEDLSRSVGDREHLQKELTNVTDTVNVLKSQVEEKQIEYKEIKEKNKKLEEQLEKRAGHLEILIKKKEEEKAELEQELKVKDRDYKQLQNMLERLKHEHEERHGRLKGVTKDKITYEKEVQLLNKEKKNLEVKIKSLEQHIRTLKETHAREIGDLRQQLEKFKALMEEKEKERGELEKRLEESVRENENLKRTNHDLENNLQKTQDENAHLAQRLHKADLSKYALPPFLAGSKSTRTGWNPKNLRR